MFLAKISVFAKFSIDPITVQLFYPFDWNFMKNSKDTDFPDKVYKNNQQLKNARNVEDFVNDE